MKYRLAMFDYDGTLADTQLWFAAILNQLAREFGFRELDETERERLRGHTTPEILRALAVPLWKLPRIATRMRRYAERDRDQVRLFPGVPEMLRDLAAGGARVAIVSSNGEATIRHVLGESACGRVSQFACGASLFGKARKLAQVLRRQGIPPAEAIYIGDETRDATAAREAGIAFGAVCWGYASTEALKALQPDLMFGEVGEISRRLAGATARNLSLAPDP